MAYSRRCHYRLAPDVSGWGNPALKVEATTSALTRVSFRGFVDCALGIPLVESGKNCAAGRYACALLKRSGLGIKAV